MELIARKMFVIAIGICVAITLNAQETQEAKETKTTTFKFGGFAKADYMFTQTNNGSLTGAGRDFHIPGTVPVGDIDVHRYTDFHVKESRFNFDVSTKAGGKKLRAFVEMDFMLSGHGDERVSNSYNPRVRHFFLEYDKYLLGQTWTTFMIVILPDDLDFVGAAEGVVFGRQPMARATFGGLQIALENPQTTYNLNASVNDPKRQVSELGLLPDFIARYNFDFSFADFSVAAIARRLKYATESDSTQNTFGTGITVGGKIKIGSKSDIRFVSTAGYGLGRYAALNFVNSSYIDGSGNLTPIFTANEYIAFRQQWTPKLSSSFNISYFLAKNDRDDIGDNANDKAMSVSANLIYSPAKKLIFGVEPMYAYRELVDGTNGDFFRLQFSAKWAFSFKTSVNHE